MSAHSHHDAHGAPHDDGHDHGSYGSYTIGFVLSVILTAIPFAIVMGGGLESRLLTLAVVIGCAIVQVLVHMVYFLHMNSRAEEGWTFISTIFTVVVVVIMIAGSVWVMYHMTNNMMPQMNHELQLERPQE